MAGEGLTVDDNTTLESPDTALEHTDDLPDDDADIASSTQEIEVQGRKAKVVPAGALATERRARRTATKAAKEAEGKLAEATGRITKLEGDIAEVVPLVNALRNRPDLVREALGQTQPSTRQSTSGGDSDITDELAREIATEQELFDAQGQPDIARGRRVASRIRNMARSMVEETVQPLRKQTVATKANANRATMGAYVRQGDITQEAANAAMGMVPEEMLADDNVMSVLYYVAAGIDARSGKAPKPKTTDAPSAPLHTEGGGRRASTGGALSDIEQTVARSRGLSDQQYRDHLKDLPDFGSPIALE